MFAHKAVNGFIFNSSYRFFSCYLLIKYYRIIIDKLSFKKLYFFIPQKYKNFNHIKKAFIFMFILKIDATF